jgi:hypothetical protein
MVWPRGAGGEQSSNRYRMERAIGAGGMGPVWLATDTLLERPVATPVAGRTLFVMRGGYS